MLAKKHNVLSVCPMLAHYCHTKGDYGILFVCTLSAHPKTSHWWNDKSRRKKLPHTSVLEGEERNRLIVVITIILNNNNNNNK